MSAAQLGTVKERHDRVVFLLAKAIFESLGLTLPRAMQEKGIVIAGVWGSEAKKVYIDQLIPTNRVTSDRKPDVLVRSGVMTEHSFVGHAQREVLCKAVQLIKRHMKLEQ